MLPSWWDRSPVSFEQISQTSFFSQWLLTWFGTFTRTCTAPQGMVVGTSHLQGRQPLPWERSPVSFEQIGQPSFLGQWLLMYFGTFTCTCTAPWWMVVGTCHLQGRQPLPMGRSPMSFGQISLGVVFQGKSWDKGPSSIALPRMVHHQWPAAPDVIWHIYSYLYCSLRMVVGTCHLQGRQSLPWGRFPVSFEQIGQTSFFSRQFLIWFGTFTLGSAA